MNFKPKNKIKISKVVTISKYVWTKHIICKTMLWN